MTDRSGWAATPLSDHGLPSPPVELAERVEQLDVHLWGTRPGAPSLDRLAVLRDEVLEGQRGDDYVLAGAVEVSADLPAVHYALVWRGLALFVQVRAEYDAAGRAVLDDAGRRRLALIGDVQQRAAEALATGALGTLGTLVVWATAFMGREWHWFGPPVERGPDGLHGALEWLHERMRGAGNR
jgi:hypothetical protein